MFELSFLCPTDVILVSWVRMRGGDLWLRRRRSAVLHNLLKVLRPYGAGVGSHAFGCLQQPCHPDAGRWVCGDLWLRRRSSAVLHNLLKFLRPYGAGVGSHAFGCLQQPCHSDAGRCVCRDLWLRRRRSAVLHNLLKFLRPYGAGCLPMLKVTICHKGIFFIILPLFSK